MPDRLRGAVVSRAERWLQEEVTDQDGFEAPRGVFHNLCLLWSGAAGGESAAGALRGGSSVPINEWRLVFVMVCSVEQANKQATATATLLKTKDAPRVHDQGKAKHKPGLSQWWL